AVLPQPARQRPAADAEDARGAPLVAAGFLEHALDVSPLDGAQRGKRPALLGPADAVGQVLDADPLPSRAHRGLLDRLAQLAQVPGPGVLAQRRVRLAR